MVDITRNIVGPGRKVYKAVIVQAANMAEVSEVVTKAGISLESFNEALKTAIKDKYLAALGSTVDSRIEKVVLGLIDMGYDRAQAEVIASANRAKVDTGLPVGLTPVLEADGSQRISERGVKAATEPTAPTAEPTAEVAPTA